MSDPRVQESIELGCEAAKDKLFGVAVKHFQQALDLDPENQYALRFLAFAQYQWGHYVDAAEHLARYLSLWPKDQQAKAIYETVWQRIEEDLARQREAERPDTPESPEAPEVAITGLPLQSSSSWNPSFDISSGRKGAVIVLGCLIAVWFFWPEFSAVWVPGKGQEVQSAPSQTIAKHSFTEFHGLFGPGSTLTRIQKQERFKDFEDCRVQWIGKIIDIDGALNVSLQHFPGPSSVDAIVSFSPSERSRLESIPKGTMLVYEAGFPFYCWQSAASSGYFWLDEGRVVSTY